MTLGLAAWAGGKSYTVAIFDPAMAGSTELKPGSYQLDLDNDKAVIHMGKIKAENPVRVETADEKYRSTSVLYSNGDGKLHIKEIHLGGTKTKVVFTETQP
jgi:hypothetical protein